jgi:malonyl-CoA decarboxylase
MEHLHTVINHLSQDFNVDWKSLVLHDPVHPPDEFKTVNRRFDTDRLVYFMLDNMSPVALIQVALYNEMPNSAREIWSDPIAQGPYNFAVFYSVFKLPDLPPLKGLAENLIYAAARSIKDLHPEITRFVTLSPIPTLAKQLPEGVSKDEVWDYVSKVRDPVGRFHTNNGAQPWTVWQGADLAENRKRESYGWMASYEYLVSGAPT